MKKRQKSILLIEGYPSHLIARIQDWETRRMRRRPPKRFELVMEDLRLWQVGELQVSFKGGDTALHRKIAETALEWCNYANLVLDFGYDAKKDQYRTWVEQDRSHIRVGFEEQGYWSWVGTQSQDEEFCKPGEISLNLEGFDQQLPPDWKGVVLHEFGHALGFHHEHQSPVSTCDFDWPKLYDYLAAPPNNWSKEMVDFNLRKMPAGGLTYSPHDPESIMHYAFPEWMFLSGKDSPCFIEENTQLSEEDKRMAGEAYPFVKRQFLKQQKKRLKNMDTARNQRSHVALDERFLEDYETFVRQSDAAEHFFFRQEDDRTNRAKKCLLIGAGQAGEDPANLEDSARIDHLLPTSYAYNLSAELLDELVKSFKKTASFKEEELTKCTLVKDVVNLVQTKTS